MSHKLPGVTILLYNLLQRTASTRQGTEHTNKRDFRVYYSYYSAHCYLQGLIVS